MKQILCADCAKRMDNDEIALNLRLRGMGIGRFYCEECLAKQLGYPRQHLTRLKEHYKANGCAVFQRRYVD